MRRSIRSGWRLPPHAAGGGRGPGGELLGVQGVEDESAGGAARQPGGGRGGRPGRGGGGGAGRGAEPPPGGRPGAPPTRGGGGASPASGQTGRAAPRRIGSPPDLRACPSAPSSGRPATGG